VEVLYPEAHQGHVLITTRSQFLGGVAASLTMNTMDVDEGAFFLLRRAGMLGPTEDYTRATAADRAQARAVSLTLGGLPLALDQAGAYMEETGCGLSGYVTLYHTQRSRLLTERGSLGADHPESVTIIFSLALQKVAQANAAASELLHLCAFLAPDAIPEELLTAGKDALGPVLEVMVTDPFQLNAALRTLLAYSLLQREARSQLLYVHQLVQTVLTEGMSTQEQQIWAERAVRAVNAAFPGVQAKDGWQQGTRILPHALACLAWQEQWNMTFSEAVHLLSQTGNALWVRGQYHQAQAVHKRVLNLRKALLGPVHPDIARSLTYLANAAADQGDYHEVDLLYQQALDVYECLGRETYLDAASVLNAWAECYRERAESSSDPMLYERADALYQRALDLLKQVDDAPPLAVAATVLNRTGLQIARGQLEGAEAQFLEAMPIFEHHLGVHHLYTGVLIGNLGALYCALRRFDEAESLLGRARAIFQELGENNHPRAAQVLSNLADLYIAQGKYEQAEPLYQEAIAIYESAGAATHPHVELFLRNYAIVLWRLKRGAEAHTALTRAEALMITREGGCISDEQPGQALPATQEQGAAFLLSCCEFGDQAKAHLMDLWGVYKDWRNRHDRPRLLHAPRELVPFLKARHCSRNRSNEERWWQGIALRQEYYEISLGREQSDTLRF
jgi:tetratricopeptide (TPR) repeat protein